uniref:Uncharacterized protein n=1 Tax=Micrurus spixii TaxID=129469 RepID=A0A2D4N3G5_9SAUR
MKSPLNSIASNSAIKMTGVHIIIFIPCRRNRKGEQIPYFLKLADSLNVTREHIGKTYLINFYVSFSRFLLIINEVFFISCTLFVQYYTHLSICHTLQPQFPTASITNADKSNCTSTMHHQNYERE